MASMGSTFHLGEAWLQELVLPLATLMTMSLAAHDKVGNTRLP